MSNLVSPCCGVDYTDNEDGRSYCCDAPILNGICSDKDCLDHAEPLEGFICENCEDFFEEPDLDYEYEERIKESIAEDRADELRDMGQ
tara:strand:- start:107 stop:370 length:264 start_codon:yes stop_codon:yes gene_type:complete